MATNSELIASQAAHAGFINRVGKGNANKIVSYLKKALEYIESRLAKEGETIRNQTRLLAVQRDIKEKLNLIYSRWEKERDKSIFEIADYEAGFQTKLIGGFVGGVDMVKPSNEQLIKAANAQPLSIGRLNSSVSFTAMLAEWKPREIATANAVITNGFALGQTTSQITKRMRDELMPLTRRNSDAVVITAVNHMSNTAKIQTYKQNNDVVIGYRLIATLDARTTAQCKSFDQTVVKWDDDYKPAPPFHWQCRTQQVPELAEEFAKFDKDATRSSKGGEGAQKVSSTQQYYDWLKNQPASFQDDALGKERGLIFRNSGLTAQEFRRASVDRLGNPLTIEQMASRDNRIKDYLQ